MKSHYPVLIGTMFLFISTTAVAHDDERLKAIEAQLQEQQSKIGTLLKNDAYQDEVIGNLHGKISALEEKNTELDGRIAAAQSTANAAQTTANTAVSNAAAAKTRADLGVSNAAAAQATANTAVSNAAAAQARANLGVSKADTAQTTANTANNKYCYITGSGFGLSWGQCPYGGTSKGGINIRKNMAGIKQQDILTYSDNIWLCCL